MQTKYIEKQSVEMSASRSKIWLEEAVEEHWIVDCFSLKQRLRVH